MISGIYQIKNIINDKIYIGSAVNLNRRKSQHFSNLRKNKHSNHHLQSAYNKYGKENFIFETLITCHPDMLIWYEQQFIDQWNPEYNKRTLANSNKGIKFSEETIEKLRKSHLGYVMSDEQKKKISESNKGRIVSEETRKKIGSGNKGKIVSPESKIKISLASIGRIFTEDRNKKISIGNTGKTVSEETRQKISNTHKLNGLLKKTYGGVISPDGTIYPKIHGLQGFCKEHNICRQGIDRVINGEFKQYKGWIKYIDLREIEDI